MFVCCECCVLSGRDPCDELITCPEESYWLVRRCVWSRNLKNEEAMTRVGSQHHSKNKSQLNINQKFLLIRRYISPNLVTRSSWIRKEYHSKMKCRSHFLSDLQKLGARVWTPIQARQSVIVFLVLNCPVPVHKSEIYSSFIQEVLPNA
jgi:hypothetical protein